MKSCLVSAETFHGDKRDVEIMNTSQSSVSLFTNGGVQSGGAHLLRMTLGKERQWSVKVDQIATRR